MIKLETSGETGTNIHPSAVVSPKAIIGENVTIGPYCVIAEDVEIGDGSIIGPHAVIEKWTSLGKECRVYQFASVGAEPQDLKFKGERSYDRRRQRNSYRQRLPAYGVHSRGAQLHARQSRYHVKFGKLRGACDC